MARQHGTRNCSSVFCNDCTNLWSNTTDEVRPARTTRCIYHSGSIPTFPTFLISRRGLLTSRDKSSLGELRGQRQFAPHTLMYLRHKRIHPCSESCRSYNPLVVLLLPIKYCFSDYCQCLKCLLLYRQKHFGALLQKGK